jgi:hypothetical protein
MTKKKILTSLTAQKHQATGSGYIGLFPVVAARVCGYEFFEAEKFLLEVMEEER